MALMMPRMALIVPVLVSALFLSPMASAHHGDTDERAESPPPGPIALYHHYLLMEQELEQLRAAHPDRMTYKVIGQSVLGLNIYGVEVTNFASDEPPMEERKRLYFDGSIHSNEQLGMEAAMDIVRWLLGEYGQDDLATFSVDNRRTFVVPLVNPDGNVRDSRRNVNDVDLNRNFPAGWGGPGSTARGSAPLSEPETQAVAKFIQEVVPHYSNSFHTGTLMLLHPYGNFPREANVTSPDHELFTAICKAVQDGMDEANGGPVPCGQVYSTIYPASGTTVDYVYDLFGSNSWTFEVDDEQNLVASVEPIRSRLGEAWIAVRHAFENVHLYGALVTIDEILPVVKGDRVVGLQVRASNLGMGGSNNTIATLQTGDTVLGQVTLPSVAPGRMVNATFAFDGLPEGASATLALAYNQTFFKGFHDTQSVELTVLRAADGTLTVSTPLGEAAAVLDGEGAAPGFEAAFLALAVLGLVLAMRRRRTA